MVQQRQKAKAPPPALARLLLMAMLELDLPSLFRGQKSKASRLMYPFKILALVTPMVLVLLQRLAQPQLKALALLLVRALLPLRAVGSLTL
jgi:hypothetical protein